MTPLFEAPLPDRTRVDLPWNQVLGSNRHRTPIQSHPYLKIGGCGSNREFFHPIALLLLVCLFALEIVGCAGALSSGSSSGTGSGSTGGTTTTPAVPTALAATAGNAQVALTWTASTGATSYHVKRSTTSGGPYTQVSAPMAASFTDTGLTNGTTYFYVVSAVNANGESVNSAQASAKPVAPSPSQAPATPTGLMATPGNAQVSLTWTASANAATYNVKRATVTGGPFDRRSLHANFRANIYRLHRHRPDQRDHIFLCRLRREHRRRKRKFDAG
jgi:hypothetical protein